MKKFSFKEDTYHGLPVPNFGDARARLLIVGLAPAAHGANRTGRMFTGDRSGDWLYRALHKQGFASQQSSVSRSDGMKLTDCLITAVCHCAPPANKPRPDEISNCAPFLLETLAETPWRILVCLGGLAWAQTARRLDIKLPKFGHGVEMAVTGARLVLGSYHPSQQNTFTGKLTEPMFDAVFQRARSFLDNGPS